MTNFDYRFAVGKDVPLLAEMNQQLIRDEKHRNKMGPGELEERMALFLETDYKALIVSVGDEEVGYALYREEPEWIYLRQLYVKEECRRTGVGRAMVEWLKRHAWRDAERIRVEVLVNNPEGLAFWRAVGFRDYCMALEMENQ